MSDQMNNLTEQNKTISEQKSKMAEQKKTIVKIQLIKNDQSKKIDDLQNINSVLLNTIRNSIEIRSCKDLKDLVPSLPTGTYEIDIDGEILEVLCDMDSASGGWTVSSA